MIDEEANHGSIQCHRCPRKMGSMCSYCVACGVKLRSDPAEEYPEAFKLRRRLMLARHGGICNKEFHTEVVKIVLPINVQTEISGRAFCPDCGLDITRLHPDFEPPSV